MDLSLGKNEESLESYSFMSILDHMDREHLKILKKQIKWSNNHLCIIFWSKRVDRRLLFVCGRLY